MEGYHDTPPKTVKDINEDDMTAKIMRALAVRDLTHDEAVALGGDPQHVAFLLECLQATGAIEAYCGPIKPSTCMYRLACKEL
jgi:hypothetical protein